MVRLGLTGGIGSGKSFVAQLLKDRGALLIDADAISRDLMKPGEQTLADVISTFGPQLLTEDGELNRAALASIVFNDAAARQQLNAIVHPAVRARSQEIAERAAADPNFSGIIVEDIPLLTETGQASTFDGVIVVETAEEVRLHRLVHQRGMQETDAQARIRAQATDAERRAIATWVVDNSGSRSETEEQIEKIWAEIQKLASKSAKPQV